jgi:outer membrane lipoprotein carrier protein
VRKLSFRSDWRKSVSVTFFIRVLFAASVCGVAFPGYSQTAAPAPTADVLAARIDHHYNSLHSLEVHFVQSYEGMGMNRRESGALLLKKPGKMRWTYTQPDGKLFILDGHNGYFYSPGDTEVQRVPVKQLDDMRSPLRLLLGHTQLAKELRGITISPSTNGDYTLTGIPQGLEKRVAAFSVTASTDGVIRAMRVEETDGITNSFSFSGEAVNVPAPDASFVFNPPPGVHIVNGMPPV